MHAARNTARTILFVLAFALGLIATQQPISEPNDVRNVTSFEPLYANAAPATAAVTGLGFRWAGTVRVYDGTNDPAWKISEAAAEWSKNTGVTLTMTTDPTSAQIVVYEVDQFTSTNAGGALGVAYFPSSTDGVATGQCRIELASWLPGIYPRTAEHTGIHEAGHCLGLAHNVTAKRTVMATSVQLGYGYDRPQSVDLKNLASIYP